MEAGKFMKLGVLLDSMQSVRLPMTSNRDDAEAYALAMELLRHAETAYCELNEDALLGFLVEARATLDSRELGYDFHAYSTAIELLNGIATEVPAIQPFTESDNRTRNNKQ